MSVTKVSKTEHLLNTFLELRSLCYSKERIEEERLQLNGNHLLQCDNIMKQMLKDLNVPSNDKGGNKDGPVMQRIVRNLGIFEREILGTESVVARTVNVENIIVHVETVKDRMSYNSNYFCTLS
tara:strand:+ start:1458 stop:1829 length:372 start_codon:yes stop_codon:yes gene_type:complete